MLNLTAKGWDEASRHALRAVSTDNRMRMWLADDAASTGLLFRCARGRIALDAPVGAPPPCHTQASDLPCCDQAMMPIYSQRIALEIAHLLMRMLLCPHLAQIWPVPES